MAKIIDVYVCPQHGVEAVTVRDKPDGGGARSGSGPVHAASAAYDSGWDAIWGKKEPGQSVIADAPPGMDVPRDARTQN